MLWKYCNKLVIIIIIIIIINIIIIIIIIIIMFHKKNRNCFDITATFELKRTLLLFIFQFTIELITLGLLILRFQLRLWKSVFFMPLNVMLKCAFIQWKVVF